MTLQPIKRDDIVECNVNGLVFLAMVRAKGPSDPPLLHRGEMLVERIGTRGLKIVRARHVTAHWRKSKARAFNPKHPHQGASDVAVTP